MCPSRLTTCCLSFSEEDVPQYFSGHHNNVSLCIQRDISSLQSNIAEAELRPHFKQFLVGESLQGCGVDDPLSPAFDR